MILELELQDKSQLVAIRAFLKALKIKHTLKSDDTKMSKKAYFEMIDSRIAKTQTRNSAIISQEEQKTLLFG